MYLPFVDNVAPCWGEMAHDQSESANPNLWDGLRGLWVPALGPTGLTLRDVSGHHNHGTLTNMDPATDWVGSRYGWALDFDGGNDHSLVPTNPGFEFGSNDSFTLAAWVKSSPDSAYRTILRYDNGASPRDLYMIRFIDTDRFQCQFGNTGGVLHTSDSANIFAGDEWRFVLATVGSGRVHLYINGVEEADDADGSTAWNTSNSLHPLTISWDAGTQFLGLISLVSIWARALAASEIQQLYADPFALLRLRSRVFPSITVPTARPAYIIGGGIAA